jgi:hypothetical protein
MTTTETQRAIEVAKKQARSIASEYIRKGTRPKATERDRIFAETARLYLELAEKKATLVKAEDAEARLNAFQEFAEERIKKIGDDAIAVADQGNDAIMRTLTEGAQRLVASVDKLQEEFDAWLEATDNLAALDRPDEASISSGSGDKN